MLPKNILSLQHPKVKHWVRLRKERAYREEMGQVLVAGEKAIRELPTPPLAWIGTQSIETVPAQETFLVTDEILQKITGLHQPDGWAAEVAMPKPHTFAKEKFILILDGIQDPGNLGTLLRTALALGWDGVILTGDPVDLFNDKAIRAARGATFRIPFAHKTREEVAAWAQDRQVWVADLAGEQVASLTLRPPLALVLSSEGQGVADWAQKIGRKMAIPMEGPMESLNVAAAGAILMYALKGGAP